MSCLNIQIKRIGESPGIETDSAGESPRLSVKELSSRLNIESSLVCAVSFGKQEYLVFTVKEGAFILRDGKEFKVLKHVIL